MSTGTPITWRRNKRVALLLACLFGPWTWVYSYNKNPGKAAVGLGLNVSLLTFWLNIAISLRSAPQDRTGDNPGEAILYTAIPTFAVLFATWIIAIIITANDKEWKLTIPQGREKMHAIILAIFLGPWTWLYTYQVDYWKFWPAVVIGVGWFFDLDNRILNTICTLVVVAAWIASIVIAAKRSNEWYKTYNSRILIKDV